MRQLPFDAAGNKLYFPEENYSIIVRPALCLDLLISLQKFLGSTLNPAVTTRRPTPAPMKRNMIVVPTGPAMNEIPREDRIVTGSQQNTQRSIPTNWNCLRLV